MIAGDWFLIAWYTLGLLYFVVRIKPETWKENSAFVLVFMCFVSTLIGPLNWVMLFIIGRDEYGER
jgi:apolipoprotein N-acyltransferase